MEIQQHDGVVVKVAGSRQGFAKHKRDGEVLQGEREAPGAVILLPSLPPLYIAPLGGGAPAWIPSARGGGSQGETYPPRQVGRPPPHPRVSNPRRRGAAHGGRPSPLRAGCPPTSAHGALRDRWPHPVDPRDPSGGPGTIPITPETFPVAETGLPIYNYSPPDHSGTPRDVRDLIRDSEQLSGFRILISLQP